MSQASPPQPRPGCSQPVNQVVSGAWGETPPPGEWSGEPLALEFQGRELTFCSAPCKPRSRASDSLRIHVLHPWWRERWSPWPGVVRIEGGNAVLRIAPGRGSDYPSCGGFLGLPSGFASLDTDHALCFSIFPGSYQDAHSLSVQLSVLTRRQS